MACNGLYEGLPNKIIISKSGKGNKSYRDICYDRTHIASIAFNTMVEGVFYVDSDGNMAPYGRYLGLITPSHYQILSSF